MRANYKTKLNQISDQSYIFTGMKISGLNSSSRVKVMSSKKAVFNYVCLEYWITEDKRYVMPCTSRKDAVKFIRDSNVNQLLVCTGCKL